MTYATATYTDLRLKMPEIEKMTKKKPVVLYKHGKPSLGIIRFKDLEFLEEKKKEEQEKEKRKILKNAFDNLCHTFDDERKDLQEKYTEEEFTQMIVTEVKEMRKSRCK